MGLQVCHVYAMSNFFVIKLGGVCVWGGDLWPSQVQPLDLNKSIKGVKLLLENKQKGDSVNVTSLGSGKESFSETPHLQVHLGGG